MLEIIDVVLSDESTIETVLIIEDIELQSEDEDGSELMMLQPQAI